MSEQKIRNDVFNSLLTEESRKEASAPLDVKKVVRFLDAELSAPTRADVILAVAMAAAAAGLGSVLQSASGGSYPTAIVVGAFFGIVPATFGLTILRAPKAAGTLIACAAVLYAVIEVIV